ncbi:MAG: hemolysin family protein [Armatimonadota bacterium]
MEADLATKLFLAATLVLVNGFFVAAEFALVKIRTTRLEELAENGVRTARLTRHLVDHLNDYLSACQLGITMASLALGWLGEPAVARLIEPVFRRLGPWSGAASHAASVSVGFAIITFVHIVFGELTFKTLAIQRPEGTSLWISYPLHAFYRMFYPAIWILNSTAVLVLRLVGLSPDADERPVSSQEELRLILTASHRSGVLKASELDLVQHVFSFSNRTAREIMVPRVDMTCLSTGRSLAENIEIASTRGFTRFPVVEDDNLDNVLGFVHIKDLFSLSAKAKIEGGNDDELLRSIIRPVKMIPETKPVEKLLREFQQEQVQIAIVLDEYGGTSGLVTLEDVLEELVGEIWDEFEVAEPKIRPADHGGYLVNAAASLAEVCDALGVEVSEQGFDTVGGLVLGRLGRVARVGDTVCIDGWEAQVISMRGKRIQTLMLTRKEAACQAPTVE